MKKIGVAVLAVLISFSAIVEANQTRLPFGRELYDLGEAGIGPCMDAVRVGHTLYVIGEDKLYVVDVAQAAKPKLIATLSGLGHVRQICCLKCRYSRGSGEAAEPAAHAGPFLHKPALRARKLLCTGYTFQGSVLAEKGSEKGSVLGFK